MSQILWFIHLRAQGRRKGRSASRLSSPLGTAIFYLYHGEYLCPVSLKTPLSRDIASREIGVNGQRTDGRTTRRTTRKHNASKTQCLQPPNVGGRGARQTAKRSGQWLKCKFRGPGTLCGLRGPYHSIGGPLHSIWGPVIWLLYISVMLTIPQQY